MLRHFIKNPRQTGALFQSSRRLAELITANLKDAKNIIELGAGKGIFTETILRKKAPDARFVAIEINEILALQLQKRFPALDVAHDCAENILGVMRSRQMSHADCIISGLPFALFPHKMQKRIMNAVYEALCGDNCGGGGLADGGFVAGGGGKDFFWRGAVWGGAL